MSRDGNLAVEAEATLLGAMMRWPEALHQGLELRPDDFARPQHRMIFEAVGATFRAGEAVDLISVCGALERSGKLIEAGGRLALVDLADAAYTPAGADSCIAAIRESATCRALGQMAGDVQSKIDSGMHSPDEILDDVQTWLRERGERDARKTRSALDILPETTAAIDAYKTGRGPGAVFTGFSRLDELLGGLHSGELTLIAGRPSMGKTALALNIATHVALNEGMGVGIFSLEMSDVSLVERMVFSLAHVDGHAARRGRLCQEDEKRIGAACARLGNAPIYIDQSSSLSPTSFLSRAHRMVSAHSVKVLILDYLQLMQGPRKAENRQQEIASISRTCKLAAKDLGVCVLAVSQLSRAVDQRGGDRKPMLSDLRESGALEQDADAVLFVWRPFLYDAKANPLEAEVIVAKQRNGPTGTAHMIFFAGETRFEEAIHGPEG